MIFGLDFSLLIFGILIGFRMCVRGRDVNTGPVVIPIWRITSTNTPGLKSGVRGQSANLLSLTDML